MVLAHHIIFTAYGFWLPNDPRGSWSDFVAAWELFRAGGKATKTDERRSLARDAHDARKRLEVKRSLKHPPVQFTGPQALAIANGFREACADAGYVFYALAILPEHVHGVLGRHDSAVTRIVGQLKSRATHQMRVAGLHPFQDGRTADTALPTPWAQGCWKVFLNSDEDVARAIEYVENNPLKENKPRQRWSFVAPYVPHYEGDAPRRRGG